MEAQCNTEAELAPQRQFTANAEREFLDFKARRCGNCRDWVRFDPRSSSMVPPVCDNTHSPCHLERTPAGFGCNLWRAKEGQ